ncbi:MAG: hypothetical protein PQJ59_17540 [Spirochaetales bacterium]|nr:hypothetical protein [Spirochaetales bacterium]
MGLLDRAVSGESFPDLPLSDDATPFNNPMGVLEGAPHFLKGIIESWDVSQAALMSFDEELDSFIPRETIGFDVTTKRKLIIEQNTLSHWLQGNSIFQINESDSYAPYFSAREAGLSRALLGLACRREESIFALVLILLSEEDKRNMTRNSLSLLENDGIMEKLYRSLNPGKNETREETRLYERKELGQKILTEGEEKVLIKMNLTRLLELSAQTAPLKEEHDRKSELLSLFSSFFNERVQIFLDGQDNIYLLQPVRLFPGKELLHNQLFLAFQQLMGQKVSSHDILFDILESPSDQKSLDQFLDE